MRSFLAIPPPEEVRDAAERLQAMLPPGRTVARDNLHLTLAFLDDQPEDRLEELHFALEALNLPPAEIRFTGLGAFGGAKPRLVFAAVDPVPALLDLRRAILRAVRRAGIQVPAETYRPHVTLARLPGRPDAAIARFLESQGAARLPGWTARAFSLVGSTLHPDGPVYEDLATYPLR